MDTTWARDLVPESLRKWRRSAMRHVASSVNHALLVYHRVFRGNREVVDPALLESLRAEFGEAFNGYIDWRDEMYQLVYDRVSAHGTRRPWVTYGTDRTKAQTSYFAQGRDCRDDLIGILAENDRSIEELSSLLEFASGYGRVTRFIVERLDPGRVWVADVSADALEINSMCFGTTARLSGPNPDGFHCERRFEVVFAGMVFSHFNVDTWQSWLTRLYDLVEPSGLLVFSTMGPQLLPGDGAEQYLVDDDGFWFIPENETAGRLEATTYGSTFVSEAWVRNQIDSYGIGELLTFAPTALANWQDVYVVRRPA